MITIDDLIAEGNTFEVKYQEPRFEEGDDINKLYGGFYYIKEGQKFYNWIEKAKRFIQMNFPNDSALERFTDLSSKKDMDKSIIYNLVAILVSLKEFPNICPIKKEKKTPQTCINITQNQKQEQTIEVQIILRVLKDSLSAEQYQELMNIIREDNSPKTKSRIIEKIKGFGESVMSNIIASLLTNPSIWNNI